MGTSNTVSWDEIRSLRIPDEKAVAAHRKRFEDEQRAYKLREIRSEFVGGSLQITADFGNERISIAS